ncbi:MAG: hypothetical protein FWF94_05885, partial [Oscillospiraceae bacterium]|nr:hypothetical protein [Oscillospiraceae bacterium]
PPTPTPPTPTPTPPTPTTTTPTPTTTTPTPTTTTPTPTTTTPTPTTTTPTPTTTTPTPTTTTPTPPTTTPTPTTTEIITTSVTIVTTAATTAPYDIGDEMFRFKGNYEDLLNVYLNEKLLIGNIVNNGSLWELFLNNAIDYGFGKGYSYEKNLGKAYEGSVIVVLYADFLKTLQKGTYYLKVEFKDGTFEGMPFEVEGGEPDDTTTLSETYATTNVETTVASNAATTIITTAATMSTVTTAVSSTIVATSDTASATTSALSTTHATTRTVAQDSNPKTGIVFFPGSVFISGLAAYIARRRFKKIEQG